MQIFILLYIEAGSYINEDEEGWEFVVLYDYVSPLYTLPQSDIPHDRFEKRKRRDSPHISTYHFVGYSSLYNFYYFPEKVRLRLRFGLVLLLLLKQLIMDDLCLVNLLSSGLTREADMDVRLFASIVIKRLSDTFWVAELYKSIYQYVLSQPRIGELTVEDPAEAFEDLRDKNDLKMLLSTKQFMEEGFGSDGLSHGGGRVGKVGKALSSSRKGKMGPPVEKGWAEKWRLKMKIAGVSVC